MIEREIKLSFPTAAEARAAVVAVGAEPLAPRRLQDDVLYDDSVQSLYGQRSALRLRRENGLARVTFKGRAAPGPMKIREEFETAVADGDAMHAVLVSLGFSPWFRYQKYREELSAPGVTITIDETPVGVFVEIEGEADGITAVAQRLGRTPDDYILDSYRTLWTKSRGEHAGDMTF